MIYFVYRTILAVVMRSTILVGGQAVIEGVMMRVPGAYATAVRGKDGQIKLQYNDFKSIIFSSSILSLPIIRGGIHLYESMKIGYKTLEWSVDINDPNDIGLDIPLSGAFGLFCCGIIQIILLILVLLGARYDVGSGNSASLTLGNSSFGPVGHHGHYGYYGQPHYYDRPWYRRPWFHRRRRVIRHRRESRTVSSFGGRKDSRRSGGGPSGGSGGGRSGGGGRKGR